jgi:uncharacterized protein with ATP-grasp and redox domains
MRQARATGKLATTDPDLQRQLIVRAGQYLAQVDMAKSPPENAVAMYGFFAELLQSDDPFARVKQESNEFALGLRDEMEERILAASDPLKAAIRVAIGGNIIDYAAQHVFDAEKTMADCLDREFILDDYSALQKAIAGSDTEVLYLCDNCGEIAFDSLLVQQLQQQGCRVTVAVREQPIINDATLADARLCGLDRICPVITNGTGCPGTPLADCSEEFISCFKAADLIISKGMGNYETLSEEKARIFFLFTVKCSEVARHVTARKQLAPDTLSGTGEMILLEQE